MISDLEKSYVDLVKGRLYQLGDDLLSEDVDLLCRYIVIRFLKTSPKVTESVSTDEVIKSLNSFINDIYSFIITFISVVNSSPIANNNTEA